VTSNVSALFINDLLVAIALSVFHKTEVSFLLVQYAFNKSHMYTTVSNISVQMQQDVQLSQRDRAAGCVIVFAKCRRLELGHNIWRTV